MKLLLILIISASFFTSCNHYSPLDNYIDTTIEADKANTQSYCDAVKFFDSLNAHKCPFDLCPYKGQSKFIGVIHTGETSIDYEMEGSDSWAIDQLHFEYPAASYDTLEDILFTHTCDKHK